MKKHEEETDDVYLLRCLPKKTIGLDIFWLIGNVLCGDLVCKLKTKNVKNVKTPLVCCIVGS